MDDWHKRLNAYFSARLQHDPDITKPGPLRGWGFEIIRAEAYASVNAVSWMVKDEPPFSLLKGEVCEIFEGYLSSVVFAAYDDGTLLWLDDHSSNGDHAQFAARERLVRWVPYNVAALATLLTETKFNFLGHARVLITSSNIPLLPEASRKFWVEDGHKDELMEKDNQVAEVSRQISPPAYALNTDGTVSVRFFVWVHEFGGVYSIQCIFGKDGDFFDYEGEKIANEIGDYFVPK